MGVPPFDPSVVQAVLFDVYGTLLEIEPRRPYRQLFEAVQMNVPTLTREQFARDVMTSPLTLREAAAHYGVTPALPLLEALESQLQAELRSIRLFSEVLSTLHILRGHGYVVGVCSNLAGPYVAPARNALIDKVDVMLWSCEVGRIKPDADMFMEAAARTKAAPKHCLMVGDNLLVDVEGARSAGMQGLHLQRGSVGGLASLEHLLDVLPVQPGRPSCL